MSDSPGICSPRRCWMPPTWLMCLVFWIGVILLSSGTILFIRVPHETGEKQEVYQAVAILTTIMGLGLLGIYLSFCVSTFLCYRERERRLDSLTRDEEGGN